MIQRRINLNEENLKWFEEAFPETSLSGVVNLFLEQLRQNLGDENTLKNHVSNVAKQVIEGD